MNHLRASMSIVRRACQSAVLICTLGAVGCAGSSAPPRANPAEAGVLAGPKVKSTDQPQVRIVNRMCPISGTILPQENGLFDKSLTRVFKDKTVGFCCTSCPRAWDALNDEDKQRALDDSMKVPQSSMQ